VRKKAQPRTSDVARVKGLPHQELSERCPDGRDSLPNEPCNNSTCPWSVNGLPYLNCSFVVYEAVALTAKKLSLEEIGVMEGITREGVRQIEKRALKKLLLATEEDIDSLPPLPVPLQHQELPPGW
jgi:hypothetical protein